MVLHTTCHFPTLRRALRALRAGTRIFVPILQMLLFLTVKLRHTRSATVLLETGTTGVTTETFPNCAHVCVHVCARVCVTAASDERPAPDLGRHRPAYLGALARAVAALPGAPRAHVLRSRRLPGPLLRGAVVIKVPAARVLEGLPVAQRVEGGAGGDGGQGALRDLQLLEVGVDGRLGAALA